MMKKLMIVGAEHPDELPAINSMKALAKEPIPNVSVIAANIRAWVHGKRFVDVNMAMAHPGDPNSSKYEESRTPEVRNACKGFEAVASLHNFKAFGKEVGIIDKQKGVSPTVLGFLGDLGIKDIWVTSGMGVQGHGFNAFGLEMDPNGLALDTDKLRAACWTFANSDNPLRAQAADFNYYEYLWGAHFDKFDPNEFTGKERKELAAFEPLPEAIAARLGYEDVPVHMLTWRFEPNMQGYWGEMVTPIAVPDDNSWPQ